MNQDPHQEQKLRELEQAQQLDSALHHFYSQAIGGMMADRLAHWMTLQPTTRILLNQAGLGLGYALTPPSSNSLEHTK